MAVALYRVGQREPVTCKAIVASGAEGPEPTDRPLSTPAGCTCACRSGSARSLPIPKAMESLICLWYPNGRRHETTLTTESPLGPGDEFDLYGRRWRVMPSKSRKHWTRMDRVEPMRLVCEPAETRSDRREGVAQPLTRIPELGLFRADR